MKTWPGTSASNGYFFLAGFHRICNQRVLSKLLQELSRISSGMFVQPQTFRRFGQHFAFWPKQTDWYHLRERNRLIFHFHYNNQKFWKNPFMKKLKAGSKRPELPELKRVKFPDRCRQLASEIPLPKAATKFGLHESPRPPTGNLTRIPLQRNACSMDSILLCEKSESIERKPKEKFFLAFSLSSGVNIPIWPP